MKMLMAFAVAGVLMLAAGCGGGGKKTASTPTMTPSTPTPTPTPTTWEQLPGVVDRMNRWNHRSGGDLPGQACSEIMACQTITKSILAAATEPTGTTRRFSGTRTVQTDGGGSVTGTYWGGWLDNNIFIVETTPREEPSARGATIHLFMLTMGIRDRNPVAGTYRGEAVDRDGNWGTAELTYTSAEAGGGQIGTAINIPAHSDVGTMRWPNIPVDDRGSFNNGTDFSNNMVGPNHLRGSFYQGGEVGGFFFYRRSLTLPNSITGAFGAKRTP